MAMRAGLSLFGTRCRRLGGWWSALVSGWGDGVTDERLNARLESETREI